MSDAAAADAMESDRERLHRKMDVEIAKLIAETAKINSETRRVNDAEIGKLFAETAKLNSETRRVTDAEFAKLLAETAKINAEGRWYPLVMTSTIFAAAAAFVGAVIGLTKLLLG